MSPGVRRRLIAYPLCFGALIAVNWWAITNPMLPPGEVQTVSHADPKQLERVVRNLAEMPRESQNLAGLQQVSDYLAGEWTGLGLQVERQTYPVANGKAENLIVSFGPPDAPRVIIGAHSDSCGTQPGADDNASGVAGLVELARLLVTLKPPLRHRIDLVAYTLEEPPYFGTALMGSAVHARSLKEKHVPVDLMISLEMIGFFTSAPGSQVYPVPIGRLFYPSAGDFIAVAGQLSDRSLVKQMKGGMASHGHLPVYSMNAPTFVNGTDFSDHRSYWNEGFPAVMVTDTAFLRNKNYHQPGDKPETLDYEKMAEVVNGVYGTVVNWK